MSHIDATFYVQVAKSGGYAPFAHLVNATQNKPAKPKGGTVLVKLTLRLPKSIFEPLEPEAVVTVPESFTNQIVEVVAGDPGEGCNHPMAFTATGQCVSCGRAAIEVEQ